MMIVRQRTENYDAQLAEACANGLPGWIVSCFSAIVEPALRRRSGQLKEALESEYPRLLKLFMGLNGFHQQPASVIETFLAPFETAYLGRCLTRLFDRVNSTFSGVAAASENNGENLPRLIDAERMVKTVATELTHSAAVRKELFCKVCIFYLKCHSSVEL